jgi:hypothetical protein
MNGDMVVELHKHAIYADTILRIKCVLCTYLHQQLRSNVLMNYC